MDQSAGGRCAPKVNGLDRASERAVFKEAISAMMTVITSPAEGLQSSDVISSPIEWGKADSRYPGSRSFWLFGIHQEGPIAVVQWQCTPKVNGPDQTSERAVFKEAIMTMMTVITSPAKGLQRSDVISSPIEVGQI